MIESISKRCVQCDRLVLMTRNGPNHVLHLLASVLLCGLWIPFWILIAFTRERWRCAACGKAAKRSPLEAASIAFLILGALCSGFALLLAMSP